MLFNSWLSFPAFKHRQLRLRAENIQCLWNSWKLQRNSWELLPPVEQLLCRSSSPTTWNHSHGCSHHTGTKGHFFYHLCMMAKELYCYRQVQSISCHSVKDYQSHPGRDLATPVTPKNRQVVEKGKKKMPTTIAAKWLIPPQQLWKIIAFSMSGWEWSSLHLSVPGLIWSEQYGAVYALCWVLSLLLPCESWDIWKRQIPQHSFVALFYSYGSHTAETSGTGELQCIQRHDHNTSPSGTALLPSALL